MSEADLHVNIQTRAMRGGVEPNKDRKCPFPATREIGQGRKERRGGK